jgi:type IV pilus assembly protein PilA
MLTLHREKEILSMKKEVKKNNKGFSLVELIVVIAIMAVLMAVLAPALLRYVEKSRVQKDESNVAEIKNAVEIALSDDQIYEAVNGTATIKVIYTGSSGAIKIENDTAAGDIQKELDTTLKASVSGDLHSIAKAASKTYASRFYVVTAEFDATKSTYIVKGEWVDTL